MAMADRQKDVFVFVCTRLTVREAEAGEIWAPSPPRACIVHTPRRTRPWPQPPRSHHDTSAVARVEQSTLESPRSHGPTVSTPSGSVDVQPAQHSTTGPASFLGSMACPSSLEAAFSLRPGFPTSPAGEVYILCLSMVLEPCVGCSWLLLAPPVTRGVCDSLWIWSMPLARRPRSVTGSIACRPSCLTPITVQDGSTLVPGGASRAGRQVGFSVRSRVRVLGTVLCSGLPLAHGYHGYCRPFFG